MMTRLPSRSFAAVMVVVAAALVGGIVLANMQPSAATVPSVSHMWVLSQSSCLPPQSDPNVPGLCKPQDVPQFGEIEIQLPGTPATWTIQSMSPNLALLGKQTLPNPGRLAGTSELFLFDLSPISKGVGTIVIREFPPTISTSPTGIFTFTFNIT